MKRMAIAGFVSLVLSAGSMVLAKGGADVVTFPVSFVITSGTCSNLPSGTTLVGEGTEQSVTTTVFDHDGVPTFVNSSRATGTATDLDGNSYVFIYANESRLALSPSGTSISGQMTDSFSLAGNGPARLHNGFNALVTIDLITNAFSADPKSSRGDPVDFSTGASHCDPL
jgi:hypothetical protein